MAWQMIVNNQSRIRGKILKTSLVWLDGWLQHECVAWQKFANIMQQAETMYHAC